VLHIFKLHKNFIYLMDTCSTNTSKPQSRFSKVPSAPYNKMFSTKEKFEKSTNNNKMNLSLGMLYDDGR
jgi:hypothetical protein